MAASALRANSTLSPTLDIWINTKHLVVRKALEALAISDGNYMGITDCFRGCKVTPHLDHINPGRVAQFSPLLILSTSLVTI